MHRRAALTRADTIRATSPQTMPIAPPRRLEAAAAVLRARRARGGEPLRAEAGARGGRGRGQRHGLRAGRVRSAVQAFSPTLPYPIRSLLGRGRGQQHALRAGRVRSAVQAYSFILPYPIRSLLGRGRGQRHALRAGRVRSAVPSLSPTYPTNPQPSRPVEEGDETEWGRCAVGTQCLLWLGLPCALFTKT